jgi:hypothetical protein
MGANIPAVLYRGGNHIKKESTLARGFIIPSQFHANRLARLCCDNPVNILNPEKVHKNKSRPRKGAVLVF